MYFTLSFSLAAYFAFAAVQGDFGVFRRIQAEAQAASLRAELADVTERVASLENKTHRLSDAYLDLDLLDEQARKVLGYARGDEIIIR